jgi:predicted transcriptional regulator
LFYSASTDLLELSSSSSGRIPRNPDLQERLERLGHQVTPEWIMGVVETLDQISAGLRRNLNRQLSLDAAIASWVQEQDRGR